ncbi:DUF1569 domain-containing protein [Mesonia sp. K7]|uniref:DUF1569 domain-containing protein n=1 Tax=Mesonia sp. K7 TaxID=2218606 RepID=UPI000DA813A5|nr:DUF1569 domain-containing protein [Mesonia sp. K7]PZD76994.1 hypothetical protein DNG35_10140 [Mesonia sp. K7]
MKSLFDTSAYHEIQERLEQIQPNNPKKWGEMNISQMLHHCQKPLGIALEKETIQKPNFLMRMMFKLVKPQLYNDKPWKEGLPTAPEFKIVSDKVFGTEKSKLQGLITEFHQQKDKENWQEHPVFGKFTKQQWGQMQYKHLDHHFRQFSN